MKGNDELNEVIEEGTEETNHKPDLLTGEEIVNVDINDANAQLSNQDQKMRG